MVCVEKERKKRNGRYLATMSVSGERKQENRKVKTAWEFVLSVFLPIFALGL